MSRTGSEGKFVHGFASKSNRGVRDNSILPVEDSRQLCMANMPPEILRDVLVRIEENDSTWPLRKNVVACAGVCQNWREVVKEIVKTPEVCGRLTFPISLKQPGPRNSLLQCYILRNRSSQTYHLYVSLNQALNDDGKFLLAARRCRHPTCTDYVISLNADSVSKGSSAYIGKLRSNFMGTKFTIYDAHPPSTGAKITKSRSTRLAGLKQVFPKIPSGNYPIAHVTYGLNVLGSRGPRRIQCTMNSIPASSVEPGGVTPMQTEFTPGKFSTGAENLQSFPLASLSDNKMLVLKNKGPRWHEQLQCWCLNFNGRVTVASVKNFQLVTCNMENGFTGPEHESVILQFGKVGKDVFTMDYRYPISAFQAFAICLSTFDTKIACE